MFKREKMMGTAWVLACVVSFTACAGGEKNVPDNAITEESDASATDAANDTETDTETGKTDDATPNTATGDVSSENNVTDDVVLLASNSSAMMMATTEDGLYRISNEEISDGVWANKIYYVDYASAKEIVLCSDASCRHNSKDCPGIIYDEELVNPEVFVYKDKVYIYSTQDDSNTSGTVIDTSGAFEIITYPAKLYEMNKDGTDRRLVKEFSQDYTMDENVMAWNGELIFCRKKLESETDKDGTTYNYSVDNKLISLNVSDGSTKELFDMSDEYTLQGTYKKYLVCGKTKYPDGYTAKEADRMDFSEWRALMDRSTEQYVFIDMESGEEIPVYEISNKDLSGTIVMNGKLYINNGTKKITCVDLETKDISSIKMDDKYVMVKSLGDRIYCWREGHEDEMYYWDPVSNEIQRADMKIKGTNLAAEIVAYTDDSIIMICDGEYQTSALDSEAYEVNSTIFGISKKQDLYKGIKDYTPVDMCSEGVIR